MFGVKCECRDRSECEGESVELDPEKDFAVLCANCHRTIHRKGAPKSVAELRSLPGVAKLRSLITV